MTLELFSCWYRSIHAYWIHWLHVFLLNTVSCTLCIHKALSNVIHLSKHKYMYCICQHKTNSGHKVLRISAADRDIRGSFGRVKLSAIFADLLVPSRISVVFHSPHHPTPFYSGTTLIIIQPKEYMLMGVDLLNSKTFQVPYRLMCQLLKTLDVCIANIWWWTLARPKTIYKCVSLWVTCNSQKLLLSESTNKEWVP